MPTKSSVKGLLFLACTSIWGYLPRKPRLQNWTKFYVTSLSASSRVGRGIVWVSISSYLLLLVRLSSTRSLVIVPSSSLVFWSVDLGVASSGNRRCSPRCRSSELQVSFRMIEEIVDEVYCAQWVTINGQRWSVVSACSSEVGSQSVQPDHFLRCFWCCMYSASVVDRALHSWNFDLHDIAPPP